jgi:hypothetical protein
MLFRIIVRLPLLLRPRSPGGDRVTQKAVEFGRSVFKHNFMDRSAIARGPNISLHRCRTRPRKAWADGVPPCDQISCSRCNAHRRNPPRAGASRKHLDADVFIIYSALRIVTLESYCAVADHSSRALSASVPIRGLPPLYDFFPV